MKISDLELPGYITVRTFETRDELAYHLASLIRTRLISALSKNGKASLAVSGGSTPIPLFKSLSDTTLNWRKVTVTLVDDRWVCPEDSASNERLVKSHLLQGPAEKANFVGFWQPNKSAYQAIPECQQRLSAMNSPFTTVVLGMGNDGHTASIFPCSQELNEALYSEQDCVAVQPTTAPHARVTLTPKRLLNSEFRILHLCGEDKVETLAKAIEADDPRKMPINVFLQHPLTIFWAP